MGIGSSESAFGGRLHALAWAVGSWGFLFFVAVGVGTVGLSVIVRGGKAFEGNLVVGSARTTHTIKLQSTMVPTLDTLAVRSEGPWRIWVR